MRHTRLMVAIVLFGSSCLAWEQAAAAPLSCTVSGQVGTQPTTWIFAIAQFINYGSAIGAPIFGMNNTQNIPAHGSVNISLNFAQIMMAWEEGPSAGAQFTRRYSVTLGPNLRGNGSVIQNGPAGTAFFDVFTELGVCTSAAALP